MKKLKKSLVSIILLLSILFIPLQTVSAAENQLDKNQIDFKSVTETELNSYDLSELKNTKTETKSYEPSFDTRGLSYSEYDYFHYYVAEINGSVAAVAREIITLRSYTDGKIFIPSVRFEITASRGFESSYISNPWIYNEEAGYFSFSSHNFNVVGNGYYYVYAITTTVDKAPGVYPPIPTFKYDMYGPI